MSRAIKWRCRFLLGVILFHTMLASPVVKRDVVQMLTHVEDVPSSLSEVRPVVLSEDTFGPTLDERGDRDKRLLKHIGLGALGVKAAKAVGSKVVGAAALGAKALTTKVVKGTVAAKAVAAGAVGLKAAAVGAKVAAAVAGLGIKAFLLKLIFGKVNQVITYKERLLKQFEEKNRHQNIAFNAQVFGNKPCNNVPVAASESGPYYYRRRR
uniref:Uncharacterized protein n=1 Tax=Clastoptera arizonana TaxID=38151 RepID=A0A1B6CNI2_9HEMI